MSEWILEVSDLNEYVRRMLASDPMLHQVRLRGEISNFKRHPSGHWYFTLKDDRCRIACVMFRQNAMRMSLRPADGMRVIVSGSVSLYAEGGTYQFYADAMRPDGQGTLYQQFEALKAKLQAEGLFDASRKRPLPMRPAKIAIVTARTGAVLQDIRRVSARRDPGVPLVLLPVKVQGAGAAEEIAAAVRHAGTLPQVEVIIVGRGGGSMEDLWAFNEECVARAIADSPVPVISAVGHETDFTIADFAADARASTPSNAAELAVPDRNETHEALDLLRRQLRQQATGAIQHARLKLMCAQRQLESVRPEKRIQEALRCLQLDRLRLQRAAEETEQRQKPRIAVAKLRLAHAMDARMSSLTQAILRKSERLEAMNPRQVLERGYAMVLTEKGVADSAAKARKAQQMRLVFHDGEVTVRNTEGVKKDGSKEEGVL